MPRPPNTSREVTTRPGLGEVQKEVLAARLAEEYGVEADFLPTRTVYVERVSGAGEACREVSTGNTSLGLRVEPGAVGSGLDYRLAIERGYLLPSHHTAVEETLPAELDAGLYGWQVVDCRVTVIQSRFSAPTPPARYFRWHPSVVLRDALVGAGTTVCAPVSVFELEVPALDPWGAAEAACGDGGPRAPRAARGEVSNPRRRAHRAHRSGRRPRADAAFPDAG